MVENNTVIPLGTMIRGGEKTLVALERFIPIGIESVEIFFWESIPESLTLSLMEKISDKCRQAGIKISSLGLYANPLRDSESNTRAKADWVTLLDFAQRFQVPVISGFTGRVPGTKIEESYSQFERFFSPIVNSCQGKGIKLAFENCPMEGDRDKGDWNIAFLPEVWDIIFNDFFPGDTVGLEFDPGHCIQLGIPPLEMMKQWIKRIYHIHGKDALTEGFTDFRFPGQGLCDWPEIFSLIQAVKYDGTVDMEGYHGKFTSHEDEIKNQTESLDYLINCRNL